MKLPKKLWYCVATEAAYPTKCEQIGKRSECSPCEGEVVYVLKERKPRKKK
jgi:hypothetical protein